MTLLVGFANKITSTVVLAADTKLKLTGNTFGVENVEVGQKILRINECLYISIAGQYTLFLKEIYPKIKDEFGKLESLNSNDPLDIANQMMLILGSENIDVDIFLAIINVKEEMPYLYALEYKHNYIPEKISGTYLIGANTEIQYNFKCALEEFYKDRLILFKGNRVVDPILRAYIAIPYNEIGDMVTAISITKGKCTPLSVSKSSDNINWIYDEFNDDDFTWVRNVNNKAIIKTTTDIGQINKGKNLPE